MMQFAHHLVLLAIQDAFKAAKTAPAALDDWIRIFPPPVRLLGLDSADPSAKSWLEQSWDWMQTYDPVWDLKDNPTIQGADQVGFSVHLDGEDDVTEAFGMGLEEDEEEIPVGVDARRGWMSSFSVIVITEATSPILCSVMSAFASAVFTNSGRWFVKYGMDGLSYKGGGPIKAGEGYDPTFRYTMAQRWSFQGTTKYGTIGATQPVQPKPVTVSEPDVQVGQWLNRETGQVTDLADNLFGEAKPGETR